MPPFDLLIPFFVATMIFACVPGPGLLYAAARTISQGRRAGWLAALGLHIGGYGHILATAFGLAALLQAVPVLYGAVKLAGAIYLIWLGYRMFTSHEVAILSSSQIPSSRKAIAESIVVELLNPKTALFYLSFLPQFTDLDAAFPVWLQLLLLGTIVNFMFSLTDLICVISSDKLTRLLTASQSANRFVRRIGGGILVALGLNLAVSKQ